jgi:hypothetical protein
MIDVLLVTTTAVAAAFPKLRSRPTAKHSEDLLIPISGGKNPFATALSSLGASKGGKVRAMRLTATRRHAIARAAANSRWRRQR